MKNHKYLLILILFVSCQAPDMSYHLAIQNCQDKMKVEHILNPFTGDSMQSKTCDPKCLIGYDLPYFSGTTITGKRISNHSLSDKITIINFWFETCPPCVAEIPGLNYIKEKYGTSQINYIAIGNDSKEDIQSFILETPFNFEHIPNGKLIYKDSFQRMWGYPFTVITNYEGIIIEAFNGGNKDSTAVTNIIRKIEPILEVELNL